MFECPEDRPVVKLWEIPAPSEKKPDYYKVVRSSAVDNQPTAGVTEIDDSLFPRSMDRFGHVKTIGDHHIVIPGPFGKITAVRIENEGVEDCWLYPTGGNLSTAIRVSAGGIRRLEFDTPTKNGRPVTVLDLQLHSDIDEPNRRVYVEVE